MNNYQVTYYDNDFASTTDTIEADGYYVGEGKRDRITFYIEQKVIHSVESDVNLVGALYPSKVYYPQYYTHKKEIATFFDPISVKLVNKEYDPEQQPHTESDI